MYISRNSREGKSQIPMLPNKCSPCVYSATSFTSLNDKPNPEDGMMENILAQVLVRHTIAKETKHLTNILGEGITK